MQCSYYCAGTTTYVRSRLYRAWCIHSTSQFIAERILRINENGSYKDIEKFTAQASGPHDEKTAEAKKLEEVQKAQDKEIFDRARLVNCGYFMHIILGGMSTSAVIAEERF